MGKREIEKALQDNQRRRPEFPNMERIKSVLFIFRSGVRSYDLTASEGSDVEQNVFLNKVIEEFRKRGVHTYAWGYVAEKKETDSAKRKEFRLFGRNSLNAFGIPDKALMEEFKAVGTVDLVMNLDLENLLPLDYLYTMSKGRFKVSGEKPYVGMSDLVIKLDKDECKPQILHDQALHYLNTIKPKTEK